MIKKFLNSLFFEGILYACAWLGVSVILGALTNMLSKDFFSENATWMANIGLLLNWVLSSLLFSFYKEEPSWQIGTLKYMLVGVVNMGLIYILFWVYTFNRDSLDAQGLDIFRALFVWLWNFFSAGSSDFVIALLTLLPTLIAFLVVVMGVIFGLNALFYTFTKPLVDKFFARKLVNE
jgi:hypothetical protein